MSRGCSPARLGTSRLAWGSHLMRSVRSTMGKSALPDLRRPARTRRQPSRFHLGEFKSPFCGVVRAGGLSPPPTPICAYPEPAPSRPGDRQEGAAGTSRRSTRLGSSPRGRCWSARRKRARAGSKSFRSKASRRAMIGGDEERIADVDSVERLEDGDRLGLAGDANASPAAPGQVGMRAQSRWVISQKRFCVPHCPLAGSSRAARFTPSPSIV